MLEILIIIALWKKIGTMLRAKGVKPRFFQWMMVLCWIGGEVLGALMASMINAALGRGESGTGMALIYGCALLGAAAGASAAFFMAKTAATFPER